MLTCTQVQRLLSSAAVLLGKEAWLLILCLSTFFRFAVPAGKPRQTVAST